MGITPHLRLGWVSSHVARMIAAQLNWTLEFDSPVGAFPVLTGSLMGKLRKRRARLFIIPISPCCYRGALPKIILPFTILFSASHHC